MDPLEEHAGLQKVPSFRVRQIIADREVLNVVARWTRSIGTERVRDTADGDLANGRFTWQEGELGPEALVDRTLPQPRSAI